MSSSSTLHPPIPPRVADRTTRAVSAPDDRPGVWLPLCHLSDQAVRVAAAFEAELGHRDPRAS